MSKNLFLCILCILLCSACEQAGVSVSATNPPAQQDAIAPSPTPSPSPSESPRSCPSGMRDLDGTSCIDSALHTTGESGANRDYYGATLVCGTRGSLVCSQSQMHTACSAGLLDLHQTYWEQMVGGNAAYSSGTTHVIDSDACSDRVIDIGARLGGPGGPLPDYNYYCCR